MSAPTQTANLQIAHDLMIRLGAILDLGRLIDAITTEIRALTGCERVVIPQADEDAGILSLAFAEAVPLYADHAALNAWRAGQPYSAQPDEYFVLAKTDAFFGVPLNIESRLIGVLLVENPLTEKPISPATRELLTVVTPTLVIALHNARQHSRTVQSLDARMLELSILNQLDRELSDTIDLSQVFDMTLDWAMRYTNANAGSLALYDQNADELKFMVDLGYETSPNQMALVRSDSAGGIAHRVALSAFSELVPDVTADKDYVALSSAIRSHMSVPVMREDRVIAVISVESRRINAFTEDHLNFVGKLSARAGVAIDNARLFTEAVREREKLAHILAEVADGVVVVDETERIVLINQAALAALRLEPHRMYVGQAVDVIDETRFLQTLRDTMRLKNKALVEMTLPNGNTYYVDFTPRRDIGWIIVMNDISPLRQTDQLKRDLIATVSHDLKQPLSVMSGYLDLLQMSQRLDTRGDNYVRMIMRSIHNMRQLIDDLLDLAKIDSGMELEIGAVAIHRVIDECLEANHRLAEIKSMRIEVDVAPTLPDIAADSGRLLQVLNNLVSNAIKYTPPEGTVRVSAEVANGMLRVKVKDNGIGISPEDQARIFDRFYRVRRPENESIEGTGLGLTIVQKLVEAQHGQIGLESYLGEGSTFYVTLPLHVPA